MAKKSLVAADARRRRIVARHAAHRAELKRIARVGATAAERADARAALAALPRDASPTRLVSRDIVDGRPRAVYAKFGLSRVRFRQMAHDGQLPGITKSSW